MEFPALMKLLDDHFRIEAGTVAVLIPACNEAEQLAATLDSVLRQTKPADRVLVIPNNCADNTAEIARGYEAHGVEVFELPANPFRKAGALNRGIELLLEKEKLPEFLVTIDADTILDEHFVEYGIMAMRSDEKLGGLSAVCRGKSDLGKGRPWHERALLWYQRAEYVRSGFVRIRRNVHTLSGAGSMLRMTAVLQVVADRGKLYPERQTNLVEDFEATLEIKRMGWKCTNNFWTIVYTDLMPTVPELMRQRLRWVGGTIYELRKRGWKHETWQSNLTLIYGFVGITVFYLWLALLIANLAHGITWDDLMYTPFVAMYQAITIRKMGWKSMIVGFLLIPELFYMVLRHTWMLASLIKSQTIVRSDWEGRKLHVWNGRRWRLGAASAHD